MPRYRLAVILNSSPSMTKSDHDTHTTSHMYTYGPQEIDIAGRDSDYDSYIEPCFITVVV